MKSRSIALFSSLLLCFAQAACTDPNTGARRDGGGGGVDAATVPTDTGRTGDCTADTDCDDGDSCTTNLCDVTNGECGYREIAGCCSAAADCDDGNDCTTDACGAGAECTHEAIAGCCAVDTDCNDGDACTADMCAGGSCTASPIADCCADGTMRPCYDGPAGTADIGVCMSGMETCVGNRWSGVCEGAVLPAASDSCDAAMLDDDCDGAPNDGCGCSGSETRACYTGPVRTQDVGPCRGGTQTCSGGAFGACSGEVTPGTEICGNGIDEDCSGSDLVCPPANDAWRDAIELPVRHAETRVMGSTRGATHDGPSTDCSCTSGGNVWYRFTLPVDSVVYFDTASTTDRFDTSLFITNDIAELVPGQSANGRPEAGLCNDDAGCGGVTGWGSTLQSRTWGFLEAGPYMVAVGGCGTGDFTLNFQNLPITEGYYFYETRLSGTGDTTTFLIGENRHSSTCGGRISGEDVRWFTTCGASQFFSLCEGDGGAFTSRRTAMETTRWDPVLYTHSGVTGVESRCSSAGATGVDCRGRIGSSVSSTTFDTPQGGSRLTDAEITRGLNAILIDEIARGSGMSYRLAYRITDR